MINYRYILFSILFISVVIATNYEPELDERLASEIFAILENNKQTYTTQGAETLESIAERYYGDSALWSLIYAANAQVMTFGYFYAESSIPVGFKLALPSITRCIHFLSPDCILRTYYKRDEALGLYIPEISSLPTSFWDLSPALDLQEIYPEDTTQSGEVFDMLFTYPDYPFYLMNYLNDDNFNPDFALLFKLRNNLHTDLTNINVTFTHGSGPTPSSIIPGKSNFTYVAERSDPLHGIALRFMMTANNFANVPLTLNLTLNLHPGRGTFPNILYASIRNENSGQVSDQFVLSEVNGSVSRNSFSIDASITCYISSNPTAEVECSLDPKVVPDNSRFAITSVPNWISPFSTPSLYAEFQLVSAAGPFNGVPVLSTNTLDNEVGQTFKIQRIGDDTRQFKIVSANPKTPLAMQCNSISSNITAGKNDIFDETQKWDIFPAFPDVSNNDTYFIKGSENLCWHFNPAQTVQWNNSTQAHPIYLEPCDSTNTAQMWNIRVQTGILLYN